jgi:integrase
VHQDAIDLSGRLIAFDTIMKETLPPIDWLVEPLVPHGGRVVLYGEFGCMKSWVLLHLGLHIAAGRDWLRGWYSCLAKAEIREVRFHDLRHSFISLLIEQGAHPKYIQVQAGHSSIHTCSRIVIEDGLTS